MRGPRLALARVAPLVACGCVACAAIVGLDDKQAFPPDAGDDALGPSEAGGEAAPPFDGGGDDVVASGDIVASGQMAPVGVAVDDTHVYWTDEKGGNVWRRDKALAGAAELVASAQDAPRHLLLDGAYVYWNNADKPAHMAGGNPATVPILARVLKAATTPATPDTLFVDNRASGYLRIALYAGDAGPADNTLYAVSSTAVHRFLRSTVNASGTQCAAAALLSSPVAVAADVDFVWWVDQGTLQTWRRLKSFATTGAAPNPQPYGPALPSGIVDMTVDDQYLYYATIGGDVIELAHGPSFDGGLADAAVLDAGAGPVDAGATSTLASVGPTPAAIAVHDGNIYATRFTKDADGQVVKVPKGGGGPFVLATGQRDPRDLVVDIAGGVTTIYWASYADGTVRRVTVMP